MACVVLPSETARLVYGYLVKENLNDIALQFLESSPYLMDCFQIVKSGYQFNTKLMGKDLPDLLQEYSVIHNLVDQKISNLCKTSILYKRIKLKCESLPEILELILFSKSKNSKSEESSSINEKVEKNLNGLQVNADCEYSNVGDVSQIKVSENMSGSKCFNKSDNLNSIQKESSKPESLNLKLNCETYSVNIEIEEDEKSDKEAQSNELHNLEKETKSRKTLFVPVQNNEMPEGVVENQTNNMNNANITNISAVNNSNYKNNNNANSKFIDNTNILTIDVDSPCGVLVNDEGLQTDSLVSNEEANRFDNPIKIVDIQEENQSENHSLDVFSKPSGEDGNVGLGNNSVVFVSQDVGNVTINQEQSQIIVIPFDCYKPQNILQSDPGIENKKDMGLMSNDMVNHQKNDIFEEPTNTSLATPVFGDQHEKSSTVDDNIMTESDFLRNRQLLYNLEKELYKSDLSLQSRLQLPTEPKEQMSVQSVSAPVIVVAQPALVRPARFRAILPKKEIHPVVVVHPLLENNKDLTKSNAAPEPNMETKPRRESGRRVKKKDVLSKKIVTKESDISENLKESFSTTAVEIKTLNEAKNDKSEVRIFSKKETETETTNEEKENLEKFENKKNETPVFATKRNSKTLSLSTPRRKSHIRALEFETPPKTNEEMKKSKTSPKIKVEQLKVERKNVRNTLFKSPIPEDSYKSPVLSKENKKSQPSESFKLPESLEPVNELSIPIATRSPNTKLSDAWENLTGVGCVIGQNDLKKVHQTKKMWDADLRGFILYNNMENQPSEKKRLRKPEKNQKDNRKSTKKKINPPKKIKPIPVTVSPSKISLTAKRNTYSINGNEEGSPIRTLIDDLKIVTPFKDIETIRPTEETPLTKLLRENINTIDVDLSMINTPSFPPTPSIIITPDLDDACIAGMNYYSPVKDCSKDKDEENKILKTTHYLKVDSEKNNKKETKEMHEKVIDDLVTKAKEIIGLGKEIQEESSMKRRPSGKILSMVKIQMLTQCDKKLMENIPINEETTFSSCLINETAIGNIIEESAEKTDLKIELEEKRKRALNKIKVVKENLSHAKNRVSKRSRKKKKSGNSTKSDKSRSDVSKESYNGKQHSLESDGNRSKESMILHSTPYAKGNLEYLEKTHSEKKVNDKILDDIRQQFPPFQNCCGKYPELSERSRKKIHYVENFLKLREVVKFIADYDENNPPKLFLKPSLRKFFNIFYKWLKHPHKRELNASQETASLLKEYFSVFEKVHAGLNPKNKKFKRSSRGLDVSGMLSASTLENNGGGKVFQSDDDEKECKKIGGEKRKEEDIEDGVVSTLPLKKRKSTVQQVENRASISLEKSDIKNSSFDNVSQTQNILQDIDVDRFLSQIHGQETS